MPARGHRVAGESEDAGRGGEREPEAGGDYDELEPSKDREPAEDDDGERDRHPRVHRAPPEVERLRATGAEDQEAEDEPDVGRVEDVRAAQPQQVLGEQRDRRRAGEYPPAAQAPPVAVLRSGDAQDERDAVSGQQRARRPHDDPLLPEDDRELEDGAHADRDEDLRDRQVEVERDLAEDLERDDDRGEVQPRVLEGRKNDRIAG